MRRARNARKRSAAWLSLILLTTSGTEVQASSSSSRSFSYSASSRKSQRQNDSSMLKSPLNTFFQDHDDDTDTTNNALAHYDFDKRTLDIHLPRNFDLWKPKWLKLPSRKTLANLLESELVDNIVSVCKIGLLLYLSVEVVNAVRDVYRELQEDSDGTGAGVGGMGGHLLSPAAAKRIVTWMQQQQQQQQAPTEGRKNPSPNISSPWIVPLAQHLKACRSISWADLERILGKLTRSQANLLQTCLLRPSTRDSFDAIGGVSNIKETMLDWIHSNCENDSIPSPYDQLVGHGRQGMALWGPPGCGKSLLVEALAQQSGWPTLIVTPSLLQRKYYGETTNMVRTLFGLVSALGPCIVVLDEVDGLFRDRRDDDHEVSRQLKTEWLQWWDGIASSQLLNQKVLIVAATNRPWDVDSAVWRRLPQRFYVGLPTYDERCDLIRRWVASYKLPAIRTEVIQHLARRTEGYTPSDLFHVLQSSCRKGPMTRGDTTVSEGDIQQSLNAVPPTRFSVQYIQQIQKFFGASPPNENQPDKYAEVSPTEIGPSFWKTPLGNFYELQVPVDTEVFDILEDLWWKSQEWESSDDGDYDDWDESDGDDGL